MTIQLQSPAFQPNSPIPKQYTADGPNISPPLKWSNIPPATKELALVCEDPDALQPHPFIHWVMYRIPPDISSLKERIPNGTRPKLLQGAMQGRNSFGDIGYEGPKPPDHSPHHYHFKLFALDTHLDPIPGLDEKTVLQSIAGHILDQGELVGTYQH